MIKVEYSKNGLKVRLSMPESVYVKNANRLHTLLNDVLDNLLDQSKTSEVKENTNSLPLRGNISDKVFNFRERIPNTMAENDKLKIQKPEMQKTLVRCPGCGQGFSAIVVINDKEYRLMIKKDEEFKTTNVIATNKKELDKMMFPFKREKSDEAINKIKDYYSDIMNNAKVVEEEKDMFVNEDTNLLCPCCHNSWSFKKWKEAYDNPEECFGYSDICDICGGEVSTVVTKNGSSAVCELCGTKQ